MPFDQRTLGTSFAWAIVSPTRIGFFPLAMSGVAVSQEVKVVHLLGLGIASGEIAGDERAVGLQFGNASRRRLSGIASATRCSAASDKAILAKLLTNGQEHLHRL